MKIGKLAALVLILLLTACAENRVAVDTSGTTEYVEVSNPAYTMSPGAPETIWVPRGSADSGIPRGGAALKKGYQALVKEIKESPQHAPSESSQLPAGSSPPAEFRENQFR